MKEFLEELIDNFNKNINYAVLRGYEKLPHDLLGHDIDLIIDKAQLKIATDNIYDLIKKYKISVLMVNKSDRFYTYILAIKNVNQIEHLYIDLFFNFSLFGVHLKSADDVLATRKTNGKVFHVSKRDEYLEKFLNTSLLGQKYPSKYAHLETYILEQEKEEVNKELNNIFDDQSITIEKVKSVSHRKLLLKALIGSFKRHPWLQTKCLFDFLNGYLKGWISPNGFSLSFTGPDGSGKTTVINQVHLIFSCIYREVNIIHFRPTVIPRIAELLQKIGLKKSVDKRYDIPHRGKPAGKFSSIVRLLYYILDYIIGYFKLVRPTIFRRGVVIFDRYYTDMIADSRRSKLSLNYKFVHKLKTLVPFMDYNFIVCVEPEKILERKHELTIDQIHNINDKLLYLLNKDTDYIRLDNNTSAADAIAIVTDVILHKQHEKYIRRIKL